MPTLSQPNLDGDDFEPDGKFFMYKAILSCIRSSEDVPEELKLRRINHLKEEVIPFW